MLKEIAPRLDACGVLVANPKSSAYDYSLRAAEAAAPSLAIEISAEPRRDDREISRTRIRFVGARAPNGGLLVPPDSDHHLASRVSSLRLPRSHRIAGGLLVPCTLSQLAV